MGDKSKIEWTDATWNPVTGCTKVSSGCKFCYAERQFPLVYHGRPFTAIRTHPDRLEQPLYWKRPRKIFVDSMGDLFHEAIPDEFIGRIWAVMEAAAWHTFQILTKRPQRMKSFVESVSGAVSNIWLGVSVEDQKTADERIPLLLQTPAALRFVSYEPALGPVDFGNIELPPEFDLSRTVSAHVDALTEHDDEHFFNPHKRLDWIIAGGESGPHARPSHPDWFRSVRDQCQAAGVAFFFKQWGEWAPTSVSQAAEDVVHFRDPEERARMRHRFADGIEVDRVSKKRAGRLLDRREWNEFPKLTTEN